MTIYTDLQGIAKELFAEFKQGSINYIAITPGAGPAHNPGSSVETVIAIDATMRGVKFMYVQQGFAVASDLQVSMPVTIGVNPAEADFVQADGVRYKIVKIIQRPAAGTPVAYTLIVRR